MGALIKPAVVPLPCGRLPPPLRPGTERYRGVKFITFACEKDARSERSHSVWEQANEHVRVASGHLGTPDHSLIKLFHPHKIAPTSLRRLSDHDAKFPHLLAAIFSICFGN